MPSTLFPQVRAELLRLLFCGQGVRLHVRELARQSGLTLGTVQDELKKLTAAVRPIRNVDKGEQLIKALLA